MNKCVKILVFLLIICFTSCGGFKKKKADNRWAITMHGDYFYESYKKDQIGRQLLIELLMYPISIEEFSDKTYEEVLSLIQNKVNEEQTGIKYCPLPRICGEISKVQFSVDNTLSCELVATNNTDKVLVLDTIELEMKISSFDVPSSFIYTNFEKPVIKPTRQVRNVLHIPEEYLEKKLRINDSKFLSLNAEDYKISIKGLATK